MVDENQVTAELTNTTSPRPKRTRLIDIGPISPNREELRTALRAQQQLTKRDIRLLRK
jgi:hypothetical protein